MDGSLTFGFAKDKQESSRIGFNVTTVMSQDRFELQPSINYSLTKDVSLTHFISIDTNAHLKWQLGLAYQLSKSAQLSVNYEEECENFTELKKSMIIMMVNYQGYQMKVPILACN